MQSLKQITNGVPNLSKAEDSVNSEPTIPEIELTAEEIAEALAVFKKEKANRIRLEETRKAYETKMREQNEPITCTAEQLFDWVVKQAIERKGSFLVDEFNQHIIQQLCLYFAGDERFETEAGFDLHKGILLVGNVGTGKSTLMRLFAQNPRCSFVVFPCLDIASDYQRNGDDALMSYCGESGTLYNNAFRHKVGGFCFDDLGTEPVAKHYGNECNSLAHILQARYNHFVSDADKPIGYRTTHITTNLSAQQIEDYYGSRIRSRMREMFNLIQMPLETPDRRR